VKALRLLQPAKGANEAKGKSYCHSAKHKKAQRQDTGNCSIVIPPAMMECLNKSSLFIGPHRNPQQNAHSKVKSYDIGEEPSDGENKCSISDEHVSSVGGGSQSITSRPDSLKSITKSSFDGVSRQPVLGQSIIGPVLNLHHAAPPREESLQRNLGAPKNIVTQSSTIADNFRIKFRYGRYGATYNMVALLTNFCMFE
jgi:hypothetical protein